jgi:antitoxin Phd
MYVTYTRTMTTEMTVTTARGRLSEVVDRVRRTHDAIALTRNGRRAAVLVDPEEYDRMVAALEAAEDAADVDALDEAKSADDGVRVPMAELLAELGDVIDAKVKAEVAAQLNER